MCGIIVVASNSTCGSGLVDDTRKSLEKLRHRGPDGSGALIFSIEGGVMVILGHTLLSIVGNENATQPMTCSTKNRTYHLVHNGEVYNHHELKEQILAEKWCSCADFETGSDSEVLLACLAYKGVGWTLEHVRGMFAFVLVEIQRNSLVKIIVSRDPFGIKPLCYAISQGNVIISSEISAFPADMLCLAVSDVLPSRSIELSLVAGEWVLREKSYFDPIISSSMSGEYGDDIICSTIQKALVEAVRIRMPAKKVNMGVLLSGGLDSSLITGIAADLLHPSTLNTFNIKYHTSSDETKDDYYFAGLVAGKMSNVDHEQFSFTFEEGLEALPKVIRCIETVDPAMVRAGVPLYILSGKIARKGFKVLLCGEGADEMFAGYRLFEKFRPSLTRDCDEFEAELERRLRNIDTSELQRVDRCTSAHGLEARVPFLDLNVVKAAMGISVSEKMTHPSIGRMQKYFLRRSFDPDVAFSEVGTQLPDTVLYREKQQFADGVGDWVADIQKHAMKIFPEMDAVGAEQSFYNFVLGTKSVGYESLVESRKERRRKHALPDRVVPPGSPQPHRWFSVRSDPDLKRMNLSYEDAEKFLRDVLRWPDTKDFCPSLATLDSLIVSMLECVPFHNLTLLTRERRPPTMDEIKQDMMSGIGGPCSVVNSFFATLLDVLGFGPNVYLLSCEINGRCDCHVAVLVQIKGLRYFVDVANGKPYDRAVHIGTNSTIKSLNGSFHWNLRYNSDSGRMELCHSGETAVSFQPAKTVRYESFRKMILRSRSEKSFGPFLTGLRFCLYPKKASKMIAVRDACIYDGDSSCIKRRAVTRKDLLSISMREELEHIVGFSALLKDAIGVLDRECPDWFEKSCAFLDLKGVTSK